MTTLLVGYDLNGDKDYTPLTDKLKSFGTRWHNLDSTWIVVADQTSKALRDELKTLIDADDELLVVDISGDAAAWTGFSDSASAWLKKHI
jgi:thermostable 8-oxoguanine DNA glycosylase